MNQDVVDSAKTDVLTLGRVGKIRRAIFGRLTGEAGRYVTLQVVAYAIEVGTFRAFLHVDPRLIIAGNLAGKLSAGIFAFVMHGVVTFRGDKSRSLGQRALIYVLVLAANAALSTVLLLAFVRLGLNETVAKVVADSILIAATFVVSRQFVFARRVSSADDSTS